MKDSIRRAFALWTSLVLNAVVFTLLIAHLVFFLNPWQIVTWGDQLAVAGQLLIVYAPAWILLHLLGFTLIQFFSLKPLPIGILKPATLGHLLFCTHFTMGVVYFFNYLYQSALLPEETQALLLRTTLFLLVLILVGVIFLFAGPSFRYILSYTLLLATLGLLALNSFSFLGHTISQRESNGLLPPRDSHPRRIRLILLNGLSQNLISTLIADQKLLNFQHLEQHGVTGVFSTFRPNHTPALLQSLLTGQRPSHFSTRSSYRYKIAGCAHEFDLTPRYIFFRYTAKRHITTTFRRPRLSIEDHLADAYRHAGLGALSLPVPDIYPIYFPGQALLNPRFSRFFSETVQKPERRYDLIRKAFFLDEFIRQRLPTIKDSPLFSYACVALPGIDTACRFFYQYHLPRSLTGLQSEEINHYRWVLERYAEYNDALLGNLINSTGSDELLAVLSLYRYQPMPEWRRLLANILRETDTSVYKPARARGVSGSTSLQPSDRDAPLKMLLSLTFFQPLRTTQDSSCPQAWRAMSCETSSQTAFF